MQEKQELAVANQNMTPDGRFRCRFSGCEKKNIQVSSSMSTLIPIILFLCRFSLWKNLDEFRLKLIKVERFY